MSAGLPSEVTAFGTCRCVSGHSGNPVLPRVIQGKKAETQPRLNPPSAFLNFFEFTLNRTCEETRDEACRTSISYRERACAGGICAGDREFAGRRLCRLFQAATDENQLCRPGSACGNPRVSERESGGRDELRLRSGLHGTLYGHHRRPYFAALRNSAFARNDRTQNHARRTPWSQSIHHT